MKIGNRSIQTQVEDPLGYALDWRWQIAQAVMEVAAGGRIPWAQVRDADAGMTEFAGVAHVPVLQPSGGDLQVELKREREAAYGKGLVRVLAGGGQVARVGR